MIINSNYIQNNKLKPWVPYFITTPVIISPIKFKEIADCQHLVFKANAYLQTLFEDETKITLGNWNFLGSVYVLAIGGKVDMSKCIYDPERLAYIK